MNKVIIDTIKNVKSVDELKQVAMNNGYAINDEQANGYYNLYHSQGLLEEDELDNVTGGSTCVGGKHYSSDDHRWLIVTMGNTCDGFISSQRTSGSTCFNCSFSKVVAKDISDMFTFYCTKRTIHDDPYNDDIGTTRLKGPGGRYWNEEGIDY